jgi:hypothetical protein
MYIRVAADGELSLQESDNLRAFSIREDSRGDAARRLAHIASLAEDNHYWLDADAVLELSGRKLDQSWVSAYWDMLASVAAFGYYDEANKRVKAHVEHNDKG